MSRRRSGAVGVPPAEELKRRILQVLELDQLQWYVETFGLSVGGRGKGATVESLMRASLVTCAAILEPLYEADVKRVCAGLGVSAVGRRKTLLGRILATAEVPTPAGRGVGVPEASRSSDRRTQELASQAPFVAIDFETADYGRDSACAVALVRVEDGRIVRKAVELIRPPRRSFEFTHIHGITWDRVKASPTFAEVWREMHPMLDGARFLAAHNASFDQSVLKACCAAGRLEMPKLPFECTVKLARKKWKLFPTKLPDVCRHLGIPLRHHDAASDAEACARIVMAATG